MNRQTILTDLRSKTCRCGRTKAPRRSVCRSHWQLLNKAEQNALYRRFGNGYEEAYEAALRKLGIHPEDKPAEKGATP